MAEGGGDGAPARRAVNEVRIGPEALDDFLRLVEHADDPLADSSGLAVWTLARAVAREVKVVLSGDGGDELFGATSPIRRRSPRGSHVAPADDDPEDLGPFGRGPANERAESVVDLQGAASCARSTSRRRSRTSPGTEPGCQKRRAGWSRPRRWAPRQRMR